MKLHARQHRVFGRNLRANSEDDGEGNWLVSYGDMMTVLFCFFVLLFSMSKPDPNKIEQLKETTAKQMKGTYESAHKAVALKLTERVTGLSLEKDTVVTSNNEGLVLTIKGGLLFDAGSAIPGNKAKALLPALAKVLKTTAKGYHILIEGHTDDSPINSSIYPSNWELSAARAAAVLRVFETQGFDRRFLRAIGLADVEPVAPNRTPAGEPILKNQAENRRVVIKLSTTMATPK